jgi:hypothetical protein
VVPIVVSKGLKLQVVVILLIREALKAVKTTINPSPLPESPASPEVCPELCPEPLE